MEAEWHWWCKYNYKKRIYLKKEGNYYELWGIWWTICTRRTKGKTK